MKYKKSQLTFFILIGAVMLIILGFVMYVGKQSTEFKTKRETLESQETAFETATVKNYVMACLEKTIKDGIKLLGKQGGRIYEQQGGIYTGLPIIQGEDYIVLLEDNIEINVSYGLKRVKTINYFCNGTIPTDCINTIGKNIQATSSGSFLGNAYPWMNFPNPAGTRDCNGWGCFGKNVLPTINQLDSMYSQLQVYVNNTIQNCTDFSVLEMQGYKIEKKGAIEINVTTTDETVVAFLKYPLAIIDSTTKKTTKLDYFFYDTKVRLKRMHELANELVINDKDNEDFTVNSLPLNFPFIDNNIIIDLLQYNTQSNIDIFPQEDNIVRITDNSSNTPFIFQFARQNRAPLIDEITSPQSINYDTTITDEIFNNINKYDPDEDTTVLYYTSVELNLMRDTSFSKTISYLCNPPYNLNSFTIIVCVSDEHSLNPCVLGKDQFMDWQEIKFDITNCP